MTDADLIRFLDVQDQIYQQVLGELAKAARIPSLTLEPLHRTW